MVRGRLRYVDALRGLAIVLLLIYHSRNIPLVLGTEMPDGVAPFNQFFAPLRMPLLMFLSGLLLPRALTKPPGEYVMRKVQMLGWPFVVWTVMGVVAARTSAAALLTWDRWYFGSYLWFLSSLFVYFLAALVLTRLPPPLVIVTLLVAAWLVGPGDEQSLLFFAAFFFAGHFFATSHRLQQLAAHPRIVLLGCVVGIAAGIESLVYASEQSEPRVLMAPFYLVTIVAVMAVTKHIDERGRIPDWLPRVGRHSIVYYTTHYLVIYLLVVHILNPRGVAPHAMILINLAAAVLVGAALSAWSERPPVAWLFRGPNRLFRTAT